MTTTPVNSITHTPQGGKSIIDYWPFPYPPRATQITTFEWLEQQTAKYLILELPVGAGKSNIGITYSLYLGNRLSNYRGDAFVLTPQKILQAQYENSFLGNRHVSMSSFYGKGNYECHEKRTTCDIGTLVKPNCERCPFKDAKQAAKRAAHTVMNYKLALLSFGYTPTFNEPRSLMVLDEAHTLEEHLVNFDAVLLYETRATKYGIKWQTHKTLSAAYEWVRQTYLPKIVQAVEQLQDACEPLMDKAGYDLTTEEVKLLKEMSALTDHRDEIDELMLRGLDYLNEHFVLVPEKTAFSFKRLYGAYSFKRILEPKANRFLFMSSTILDKDGFCRDLGIDPKEAAFLSLTSEFPVENRPVLYLGQMKMNTTWKDFERASERTRMLKTIKQLLQMHKDESGIIHTANFQIAEWLVENIELDVPHRVYHHNPSGRDSRNAVIDGFMADTRPSVLISPSITEGLDLKDDLGRFAIFVKVPFGNLGDAWIKRRMEISSQWYQRQALIDIIQGGGRIVRTPTDKGNVYILDASWSYLYKTTYNIIPRWWRDAYSVFE